MIEINDFKAALERVAKTRDGETVLTFLSERYLFNNIKDETLARQVGQRDVVLFLKRSLEKPNVQK